MKKPKDHLLYKLIGTSQKNDKVICYVLCKQSSFCLEHIEYSPGFKNVWNTNLQWYLCTMEEDILKNEFDDHKKTELYTDIRKALELPYF